MTGWRGLLRLAWRRDRVMIIASLLVIWALTYYSAAAMPTLYSNTEQLMAANQAANESTGVVAIYGHIYHLDSVGGIGANKVAMLNFLVLSFLVIAVVRRHTRAEEESGRFELLGSTSVGRHAPLGAAVLLAILTSLVSGFVTIPASIAGGWPVAGSVLFGLAQAGVGLSFAGLTAVAVQLSSSNRACGGWIFGALGVAFVLRTIGDVSWNRQARVLSWASPLGWGQQVRYFDGDRAWPLVVPVLFLAVTLPVAGWLQGRRDLGAGLLADRAGSPTGTMGTPAALAWRLQRAGLVGWVITFVVIGALFGSIINTVGGFMTGSAGDILRKLGGVGSFNDIYLTLVAGMGSFGAAAFGVSALMRLRSEESTGHMETLLATPVTRRRFLASHLIIGFVGATGLVALLGVTMAGAHLTGSTGFWRESSPALAYLPAIWVMTAAVAVVVAWLPRVDWLGWALLAAVVVLGELGSLIGLPGWTLKISPFAHVPRIPVEPMSWTPELVMSLIAVGLVGLAVVGFRRRDMPVT